MEGREETNPYIADLTKNVITQEFTNCSIKAVRLADRIKEWHDKQSKPLLEEIERLKGEKDELIKSHECGIFCNTK